MSFWSDLYAGDVVRISRALHTGKRLQGTFVIAHAPLPGIVPDARGEIASSPDLITDLACEVTGFEPIRFESSILARLGGRGESAEAVDGAYLMGPRWVQLFAGMSGQQVRDLARRWLVLAEPGTSDDPDHLASAALLLHGISEVCQAAQRKRRAVVYTWTV